MTDQNDTFWASYPFKVPLTDALAQIQYGLHHLIYDGELEKRGIAIDAVELQLVVARGITVDGKAGAWLVTVAGEVSRKTTETLKIVLPPATAGLEAKVDSNDVIGLAHAMFQIVDSAAATYPPLMFGSSELIFELLASEKASLEIGKRGIVEKVLDFFGISLGAGVAYEQVKTSTATIKFKNPALEEKQLIA